MRLYPRRTSPILVSQRTRLPRSLYLRRGNSSYRKVCCSSYPAFSLYYVLENLMHTLFEKCYVAVSLLLVSPDWLHSFYLILPFKLAVFSGSWQSEWEASYGTRILCVGSVWYLYNLSHFCIVSDTDSRRPGKANESHGGLLMGKSLYAIDYIFSNFLSIFYTL